MATCPVRASRFSAVRNIRTSVFLYSAQRRTRTANYSEVARCQLRFRNINTRCIDDQSCDRRLSRIRRCDGTCCHGDDVRNFVVVLYMETSMKNRVRELRKSRSWTQEQFGDLLAVSRQTINSIENGRFDPSLTLALKIAQLLDESVERIFILQKS